MFQRYDITTAIEIGTSKICVLIGKISADKELEVIGFGESLSNNSVVKGEIVDMAIALEQLNKAIYQAESSSSCLITDRDIIAISITGTSILSHQGSGTIFINSDDRRIRDKEISSAIQNAQESIIQDGRTIINSFDSYFVLDGNRRIRNPSDMPARKLEACIHAVHCENNLTKSFYSLLNDAGFDDDPLPVFSGIASAYGVLTEDEKESGVLLLDMGAGTTEYLAIFNMGILASGVLPVGFEHLANDLSLGLDLHISDCRKLLQDGTIVQHINERKAFIEIRSTPGNIRKIPLASFETIIDLRLREIFQIIHSKLTAQNILQNLNSGGVLTGGGALFPQTAILFSEIFNFPARIGKPFSINGTTSVTGIESPQYATIWGALKFAEELDQVINSKQKNSIARSVLEMADNVASDFLRSLSKIFKSVKF